MLAVPEQCRKSDRETSPMVALFGGNRVGITLETLQALFNRAACFR
jgi:hypothetical protein